MIDRQTPSLTTIDDPHSDHSEFVHHAQTPSLTTIDDPLSCRMIGVSIFPNKTGASPRISKLRKWREVRSVLMLRTVRTEKDGPLIGGYMTAGRRCDDSVKTRGFIQLDIDTKTKTDKAKARSRYSRALRHSPTCLSMSLQRQADQEQLAAARAAADRAMAELVELARRLAAIAETQTSAGTAEAEPEPPRRSKLGRARGLAVGLWPLAARPWWRRLAG